MPRWGTCTGSLAAIQHLTGDNSSVFAREGTAAHTLGERALEYADQGRKAEFWIGETISVTYEEAGQTKSQDFIVDQEMADYVQVYADQVLREPGELMIEQRVDLSEVYGVDGQFGTADAVVLNHEQENLYVGDLKYGRGVQVYAKDNEQLYSYAAGVLRLVDMLGDWKTITVAIHQPRLHHYDEHVLQRAELEDFIASAHVKAAAAGALLDASPEAIEAAKVPGDKQCQWCPIKGNCVALASWVHEATFADFTSLGAEPELPREAGGIDDTTLGKLMARADIIAKTVSEWRAEGLRRVESGIHVPGWKLVEGRMGSRKWRDNEEAKKLMKGARMKDAEMYKRTLLTAPAAEKVIAKKKPKVWTRLLELIVQSPGKPALAPETDRRPALVIADSESFQDTTTDDCSDLL